MSKSQRDMLALSYQAEFSYFGVNVFVCPIPRMAFETFSEVVGFLSPLACLGS